MPILTQNFFDIEIQTVDKVIIWARVPVGSSSSIMGWRFRGRSDFENRRLYMCGNDDANSR